MVSPVNKQLGNALASKLGEIKAKKQSSVNVDKKLSTLERESCQSVVDPPKKEVIDYYNC